jgi:hypothetical protein
MTVAIMAVGSLAPNAAQAMTLSTPAAIAAAVDTTNLAQDVAYLCNRVAVRPLWLRLAPGLLLDRRRTTLARQPPLASMATRVKTTKSAEVRRDRLAT